MVFPRTPSEPAAIVIRSTVRICVLLLFMSGGGKILGIPVATGVASSLQAQNEKKGVPAPTSVGNGDQMFAANCASCHGLDARGGERGPDIADSSRVQRMSDDQVAHIVENGIPGTGMRAFHSLQNSEIRAVVAYVRTLQGAKTTIPLPGDPARGKALFFGKIDCSGCHMAAGQGGFIASDLSGYTRTHSVDETRSAITMPNPNRDRLARPATIITRDGRKRTGRIRNEDNFSLQLQLLDGSFHFFSKSEIKVVTYGAPSLMPGNYSSILSADELNDLISFLMTAANANETGVPKEVLDEEE